MDKPNYGLDLTGDIEKTYPKGENFTDNGTCSRCGNCCTNHLFITEPEKQQIMDYMNKNSIKPHHHTDNAKPGMVVIDLLCPFLDTNNDAKRCTIYPVRPAICQVYKCDRETDDALFADFDKVLREKGFDTRMTSIKSIDECNVGQTFFQNEYEPKAGDAVIINELHMMEHLEHKNEIFIMTEKVRENNGKTEVLLERVNNRKTKLWFDIQGLTRLDFV